MDNEIGKDAPKIQADNQSIAMGEINISGTVTGNITIGHTIVQPADARLRHDLGILLKNVKTTWIKGVLEKSVHEAALLELGLELREEAVDDPWRMVIESPDQSRETLPRGRRIKDIFDEANGLLLILGEPGSGKTTTLLQLARDLIAEVDSAFTQPVPVILNLSTWTSKQQPLDEWLVAELNSKYRLPKKDGQRWLKERRILPLLDGLDEVRAENRAACVEKINQLVTDYGLQGMVVCSRIKEYTALEARLAFYRAIYIQPLTSEQVDEYLNEAGDKLASLRATLQADEALRSMAQSPLILNIMSLAYQNISAEDLSDPALATDKARRKQLFDTYIARMFMRKAGGRQYEDEQTKQRLIWLARNMQRHHQEVFLIEGLEPSWLEIHLWQWVYYFVSRVLSGMSFGLVLSFLYKSSFCIILGFITGFAVFVMDVWRLERSRRRMGIGKSSTSWWSIIDMVVVVLSGISVTWLVYGTRDRVTMLNWLVIILLYWLILGLRGRGQNLEMDIRTVEALGWSWRNAIRGGLIAGISGTIFIVSIALFARMTDGKITVILLAAGLIFGLIFALIGLILNGLSREIVETKSSPNQGIRLSIRNAIYGGLILGLSIGLLFGLFVLVLTGELAQGLINGKFFGRLLGIMGVFWYGGLDVIQHYTLRLILLIQGHTPANYSRFLDYAVDRIFLQKVGGGYRFIHRLLLEHFAEIGEMKTM